MALQFGVMKIAAISDIHGNVWALDAVLKDIAGRGITEIVNLGDSLYGPLEPAGTGHVLIQMGIPSIAGNEDRILLEAAEKPGTPRSLTFTRQALLPEHWKWLESLMPGVKLHDHVFLCHGTPDDDNTYLLEDVSRYHTHLRTDEEIERLLAGVDCPLVLCGHSHFPRAVQRGKQLIVNPGSVGLPAYDSETPPHVIENGSPHARYAIVEDGPSGWTADLLAVPYDWQTAVETARENGRDDWALWLSTGRAET